MDIRWSPSGYYGTLQKKWNLTTILITSKFRIYCSGLHIGNTETLKDAQRLAQDWVDKNVV